MQSQAPTSLEKHPLKPHGDGSALPCSLSIPTVVKPEILGFVFELLLNGAAKGAHPTLRSRKGLQLHLPATKQSCGAAGR